MLNVFFTIDVEIWCNGWKDIDARFASSFDRYIHGTTPQGQFGLPFQMQVMNDHGLRSVCFVEPLFSARFGQAPLDDIVGLVNAAGHETQLHLHPEWVDEARTPLLPGITGKRAGLRNYSLAEQTSLVASGLQMLARAGAPQVNALRAGGFGFNHDTLAALAANGVPFDSSYNATLYGPESGVRPGELAWSPFACAGVQEYPMSVYHDGTRKLRHVQLTACSFAEMEHLLWQALEAGHGSLVMLSHSFELLNAGSRDRSDPVTVRRFRKLCAFLDRNRDVFRMCGFQDLEAGDVLPSAAAAGTTAGAAGAASAAPPADTAPLHQPPLLRSPLWRTGARVAEQAYRRRYG